MGDDKVRPAAPGEETNKQQLGAAAAEFASSVTFRAQIARLCRCPRLVVELLAEVAAEHRIGAAIGVKLARYDALDFEALRIAGGDVIPLAPLHVVRP